MSVFDIFCKRVEGWASEEFDDRISTAFDNFEEWIQDFDDEEDKIVGELLDRFCYYSESKVRNIIKDLSKQAVSTYGISNQDSVVSVVRKVDGTMNSSHEYWLKHKELSGLNKNLYIDSLFCINEKDWQNIKKVVFVDDCSGTGTQFTDFLDRVEKEFVGSGLKKSLKGKEIILLTVHVVADAIDYIQAYAKKAGLLIHVECYCSDKKAFWNKNQHVIDLFMKLSEQRNVKCIRGFREAEALMAFYNNTPNDTLGIFWCNTENNKALFPRFNNPVPGWKNVQSKKKERLEQQYESKATQKI